MNSSPPHPPVGSRTLPLREELKVEFEKGGSAVSFDEAAGHFLGCEQQMDVSDLQGLGPVVISPGSRMTLGQWMSVQVAEGVRDGFWGLCLDEGFWIDVVAVGGSVTIFLDRRSQTSPGNLPHALRVHRVRNQLNAIQMNADLGKMLAKRCEGGSKMEEAADRVLENARLLEETLEPLNDQVLEAYDLAQVLGADLLRRCGSRLVSNGLAIPVSWAYFSSVFCLMTQWLVFRDLSADEPVRLTADARAQTFSIETPGLERWIAHSLVDMADWLRGSDISVAPTRAFRGHGFGCGYWRDGQAAGADFAYRSGAR